MDSTLKARMDFFLEAVQAAVSLHECGIIYLNWKCKNLLRMRRDRGGLVDSWRVRGYINCPWNFTESEGIGIFLEAVRAAVNLQE